MATTGEQQADSQTREQGLRLRLAGFGYSITRSFLFSGLQHFCCGCGAVNVLSSMTRLLASISLGSAYKNNNKSKTKGTLLFEKQQSSSLGLGLGYLFR